MTTTATSIPTKLTGIDPKRVVNKEYLNSLGDFYKCSICFNVMVNPTDCEKCGHSYCNECISRLKCPYNCETKTLKLSSMGIKAMLSNLFFFCENEGCELKIAYSNVQAHDLSCDFQRITCPSTGCNLQLARKDLEKHIKDECVFSLITCRYCGYEFVKKKIEEHEEACSSIYNAINGDGSVDIANMNIDPKKYLQALSLNISKLVKESRTKGKPEEEKDNKSAETITSIVESILEKRYSGSGVNQSESNRMVNGANNVMSQSFPKEIKEEIDKKMSSFERNLQGLNLTLDDVKKIIIEKSSQALKEKEEEVNKDKVMREDSTQKNHLIMTALIEKVMTETEAKLNKTMSQFSSDLKSQITFGETLNSKIDSLQEDLTQSKNTQKELKEIVSQPLALPLPQIEIKEIEKVITILPEIDFTDYFTRIIKLIEQTNTAILNYHQQLSNEVEIIEKDINSLKPSPIEEVSPLETFTDIITSKDEGKDQMQSTPVKEEMTAKTELDIKEESINHISNTIKIDIKELNEEMKVFISNEMEGKITTISNGIEGMNTEILSLNKKVKEIKGMISEEFEDMTQLINDNNKKSDEKGTEMMKTLEDKIHSKTIETVKEAIENNPPLKCKSENSVSHCIEFNIDQLSPKPKDTQKETLSAQLANELSSIVNQAILPTITNKLNETSVDQLKAGLLSEIDIKLQGLESKMEQNIDSRLKAMFCLKWCSECEKVDYFYGFIKCSICLNESCKSCVMLCMSCKHLVCKNCSACPKCSKPYCQTCRIFCQSCEPPIKYCENCIQPCQFCKKQVCTMCIRQCITCRKFTCKECSKTCKICEKHSCFKCDTSKNFRTCSKCSQTACKDCIHQCNNCERETCQKCFITCSSCKKRSCNQCSQTCHSCEEEYCLNCSKDFSKCGKCSKGFCVSCIKNLRRCKKCGKSTCKDCCNQCKKCKNIFCLECSIGCDNCNGYMCSSCTYKCVCDMVVFCEKCLLDINPIGPHDCVFFGNDSACFKGIKSRSKAKLPNDFEAKLFLEKYTIEANLLIGLTDNNRFDEDSVTFIDNVWAFKIRTGEKYSSAKSLEPFYNKECREGYSILIAKKNENLFFRVNSEDMPPAYTMLKRDYWLYIENDAPVNSAYVRFVYIRKI